MLNDTLNLPKAVNVIECISVVTPPSDPFAVCCSDKLDDSLKAVLQRLGSQRRYEFWSQYVKELVCLACEDEESGMRSLPETQMLISAWRTLLILSTSHVSTVSTLNLTRGVRVIESQFLVNIMYVCSRFK